MAGKIRWGILSTGRIAGQFAGSLSRLDDAELVAVGSRSQASADRFGDEYGIPRRYATYEALVADPDVDVIYVATPHPLHEPNTILCLEAGKAVLCEKPFAMTAAEAERMIATARREGRFLMEGMWSRFLPAYTRLRALVAGGAIGTPRMLRATLAFTADFDPESRLFNPELGGGALLDLGIYPISLAVWLLGLPDEVAAVATMGETGVDEQAVISFGYASGALAMLGCSFRAAPLSEAEIAGSEGRIVVERRFHAAHQLTLYRDGAAPETIDVGFAGRGFEFQAAEVHRCLREGRLESDVMPLGETLEIMRLLDRIRGQWGLRYPGEG